MLFSVHQMEYNESILISQENLIDEETLKRNKLCGTVGRWGGAEDAVMRTDVFCEETFLGNI